MTATSVLAAMTDIASPTNFGLSICRAPKQPRPLTFGLGHPQLQNKAPTQYTEMAQDVIITQ